MDPEAYSKGIFGNTHLVPLPLLSPLNEEEDRSGAVQPGLKQVLIWEAEVPGGSLTCCTTALALLTLKKGGVHKNVSWW